MAGFSWLMQIPPLPNAWCGYQLYLHHVTGLFLLHSVTYQDRIIESYSYRLKYFRSFKDNWDLSFP